MEIPPKAEADDGADLYELADEPAHGAAKHVVQSTGGITPGGLTCPYCNQPREASSSLCVFCGSPLEPVKSAAVEAPVMIAPVKMRPPTREEKGGQNKLLAIIAVTSVLLIGLLIAVAVKGIHYLHPPAATNAMSPGDAAIVAKIEEEQGTEARDWLRANDNRMLGNWNKSQAQFHLDELYQMGAVKIYAFGSAYSTTIAIELPDDPAKRKALFDWQTKWHSEMRVKPDVDQGQKWMEIQMRV